MFGRKATLNPVKQQKLVSMLSVYAPHWTDVQVERMIAQQCVPDATLREIAAYVADNLDLATVSDDEFIAAVRVVSLDAATLLAEPRGLDLLHLMSAKLAVATGTRVLSSLFGRAEG